MKFLSEEEYLKLIVQLVEQQYNEPSLDGEVYEAWSTAESDIKKKIKSSNDKIIDASLYKKDKILESLYLCQPIKIGRFVIKISKYEDNKEKTKMNIYIYEDKYYTYLGKTNEMLGKIDVLKDRRFVGSNWVSYFNQFKLGVNIPIEVVVDIVKWLQVIDKLVAFL